MNDTDSRIVVVGLDDGAERHVDACAAVATEARFARVERMRSGAFDFGALEPFPAATWRVLAAVGPELLNLSRLGLMSELLAAGYKLASVIDPTASTPPGFRAARNVVVGARAVIGSRATLKHNVWIGAGAIVGGGVTVEHSTWIGAGAIIGEGSHIGEGSVVTAGAIVAPGVKVGKQCELGIARPYLSDVPDRSFYNPLFDEVAQILPHAGR